MPHAGSTPGEQPSRAWYSASYLASEHWRAKREQALAHYGSHCGRCGRDWDLHVHHKSYERLGNEDLSDLEILCRRCHERVHGIAADTRPIPGRVLLDHEAAHEAAVEREEWLIDLIDEWPENVLGSSEPTEIHEHPWGE